MDIIVTHYRSRTLLFFHYQKYRPLPARHFTHAPRYNQITLAPAHQPNNPTPSVTFDKQSPSFDDHRITRHTATLPFHLPSVTYISIKAAHVTGLSGKRRARAQLVLPRYTHIESQDHPCACAQLSLLYCKFRRFRPMGNNQSRALSVCARGPPGEPVCRGRGGGGGETISRIVHVDGNY